MRQFLQLKYLNLPKIPAPFIPTTCSKTIWVDVNGSADNDGQNPSKPTTLSKALSTLSDGTSVVIASGNYTLPADIIISNSNISISGVIEMGKPSVTIANKIIVSNITAGVSLIGLNLTNVELNGHLSYMANCQVSSSIRRIDPNGQCIILDCESFFAQFIISGNGTNNHNTTITGTKWNGADIICSAPGHVLGIFGGRNGPITISGAGTILFAREITAVNNGFSITANTGTVANLVNITCSNTVGTAQSPINIAGGAFYSFLNCSIDYGTSVLAGTDLGFVTTFSGLRIPNTTLNNALTEVYAVGTGGLIQKRSIASIQQITANGTAVLVAGNVVVNNANISATSKILVSILSPGGTIGSVYVFSRGVGTFTVRSTSALDTSTVLWALIV